MAESEYVVERKMDPGGSPIPRYLVGVTDLETWWNGLRDATRQRLLEDPRGALPADLWAEITRYGRVSLVGVYSASMAGGVDGYRLSSTVAAFAEERAGDG